MDYPEKTTTHSDLLEEAGTIPASIVESLNETPISTESATLPGGRRVPSSGILESVRIRYRLRSKEHDLTELPTSE